MVSLKKRSRKNPEMDGRVQVRVQRRRRTRAAEGVSRDNNRMAAEGASAWLRQEPGMDLTFGDSSPLQKARVCAMADTGLWRCVRAARVPSRRCRHSRSRCCIGQQQFDELWTIRISE